MSVSTNFVSQTQQGTNKDRREMPFVSVVVPVYNDAERIGTCITALLHQTYPRDRYEILIVDNGSTDGTTTVIKQHPVTLLIEDQIQSSYAARNTGIAQAQGEIIALTDSDCTPAAHWLAEGVQKMLTEPADLVGGRVHFVYSKRPTGAEIYDSLSNLDIEKSVRERNVAKTANLFVRRDVFRVVGAFPSDMQSGGDIFWTGKATQLGFKLVYAVHAEVAHPTRKLKALLQKQYRVGKGHQQIRAKARASNHGGPHFSGRQKHGKHLWRKVVGTIKGFLPDSISLIRNSLQEHHIEVSFVGFWRVWFAAWLGRSATTVGSVSMAFKKVRHRSNGRELTA